MNEQQIQQKVIQLVQAAASGNPQAQQQIQQIKQAAQSDPQYAQIAKLIEAVEQQMGIVKSARGSKLNYIKSLKTQCNQDEELVYLKKGGRVCPVCQKKKTKSKKSGGAIESFKEYYKCGGKKKKMQGGDKVTKNDTIHINGQPRSLVNSNGPLTKKYKPITNKEYQDLKKKAQKGDKEAARKVNKQNSVQTE